MIENQYSLYAVLAPIAAIIVIATMTLVWRLRNAPGATALFWCMFTSFGYLIFNYFELIARNPAHTLMWAQLNYFFIAFIPVAWIGFALSYCGKRNWLSLQYFGCLSFIPIITILLAQTNDLHGLIWKHYSFTPVNGFLALSVTPGAWFFVHVFYSYTLIVGGAAMIAFEFFPAPRLYRIQSEWIIVGAAIPLVVNAVYSFRLVPNFGMDYTPLAFSFACLAFIIGIYRHRLLDIVPVTHTNVLDNLSDALIVLDSENRIVDFNTAASCFLNPAGSNVLGKPVTVALSFGALLADNNPFEVTHKVADKYRQFEVLTTPLISKNAKASGKLVTLHDITQRTQLMRQAEKLASLDHLTGVYNRRQFTITALNELKRAQRYNKPLSLIVLDLDHFKRINNAYGHLAGDFALKEFASLLKKSTRAVDMVARFGGEEFIILLPETTLPEARKAAERIRSIIECTPIPIPAVGSIQITASLGVTCYTGEESETVETLFERADQALYRSKTRGRNRVTVWREPRKPRPARVKRTPVN